MPDLISPADWDALIQQLPGAHILQSWEWARSKQQNGWSPSLFGWKGASGQPLAAVMILRREFKLVPGLPLCVLYCPKGPTLDWSNPALVSQVLDFLQEYTQQQKAIQLKMDPDIVLGVGVPGTESCVESPEGTRMVSELQRRGWQFSTDQIQFRNTVLIDIQRDEDTLLAAMKQKTRYNIRLAQRKGVSVREGTLDDLPLLYRMYAKTAVRDGFVIRHEAYYTTLWREFFEAHMASFLFAEFQNAPIAAIVLFHFAGVARYMFGMSLDAQRELMPNHLLQWEGMRLAKRLGCHTYDMWGAPDVFDESDSMWGVFRFKEGFNGTTTRHIGAWDFTTRPMLYRFYTNTLPRVLDVMRRRGKAQNRKQATHD